MNPNLLKKNGRRINRWKHYKKRHKRMVNDYWRQRKMGRQDDCYPSGFFEEKD
jgi:hypothetical protein